MTSYNLLKRSEPQTKKHLTAEEHAMRRAEMARRRKNLSEKRNEEEKVSSLLNLLLCDCSRFCVFALHLHIISLHLHS